MSDDWKVETTGDGWRIEDKPETIDLVSAYPILLARVNKTTGGFERVFPLDVADTFDARQRLVRALAQWKIQRLNTRMKESLSTDTYTHPDAVQEWRRELDQIRAGLDLMPPTPEELRPLDEDE